MTAPKCKCGVRCQWYGKFAGYSVACVFCNEKNAERQRIWRALKKKEKAHAAR